MVLSTRHTRFLRALIAVLCMNLDENVHMRSYAHDLVERACTYTGSRRACRRLDGRSRHPARAEQLLSIASAALAASGANGDGSATGSHLSWSLYPRWTCGRHAARPAQRCSLPVATPFAGCAWCSLAFNSIALSIRTDRWRWSGARPVGTCTACARACTRGVRAFLCAGSKV